MKVFELTEKKDTLAEGAVTDKVKAAIAIIKAAKAKPSTNNTKQSADNDF